MTVLVDPGQNPGHVFAGDAEDSKGVLPTKRGLQKKFGRGIVSGIVAISQEGSPLPRHRGAGRIMQDEKGGRAVARWGAPGLNTIEGFLRSADGTGARGERTVDFLAFRSQQAVVIWSYQSISTAAWKGLLMHGSLLWFFRTIGNSDIATSEQQAPRHVRHKP